MPADLSPLGIALARRLLTACLWRGSTARPAVALTFDDGPDPRHTPPLLDALDRLDLTATFFWLGDRLDDAPEVVARVAASRHQIALHGLHHRPFLGRRTADLLDELDALRARIAAATGRDPDALRWVRPPFGLIGPRQARRLLGAGYRPVVCDVLPADWSAPPALVVRRVLARARPGSIIALHDGNTAGPRTPSTVEALVPGLRARGLRFASVADLAL